MSLVCLNGEFFEESEARISPLDEGFLSGHAVYDTVYAKYGRLWRAERHWERLGRSCELAGVPLPRESRELTQLCLELLRRNHLDGETRIRVQCSPGVREAKTSTVLITAQRESIVALSPKRAITREAERPLPHIKSCVILPTLAARQAIQRGEADEVLLVNRRGEVTEGTVTNLFVVERGRVITPPAEDVLPGVVRECVCRDLGRIVHEDRVTVRDLERAHEIFLTNTIHGVQPVVEVDGRRVGKGKIGQETEEIARGFHELRERELLPP